MTNTGHPHDRHAPEIITIAVAEILACCDSDPERRRAHRRRKLEEYPAELRDRIRAECNRRIEARNTPPEPLVLHGDPNTSAAKESFFRQGREKFGDTVHD